LGAGVFGIFLRHVRKVSARLDFASTSAAVFSISFT